MVWITAGSVVFTKDWQRTSFSVGSTIIRVQHTLSPTQAALHRGVVALVDNQGGGNGIIGAQRSFPSTGTEVFVFPEIVNLSVYGLAIREFKGPVEKSWNWVASVAYWVNEGQDFQDRLDTFESKLDDAYQLITTLVNFLL